MGVLKERLIAGAPIVGTVIGCLGLGYAVGKDVNQGLVDVLRERTSSVEREAEKLRTENSSLKIQIAGKPIDVDPPRQAGADTGGDGTKSLTEEKERMVALRVGETSRLFSDELTVSLVGISYEGDPLRYKVVAVIGAKDGQTKTIDKVDVGYTVEIGDFVVKVITTDIFSAQFLVSRSTGPQSKDSAMKSEDSKR